MRKNFKISIIVLSFLLPIYNTIADGITCEPGMLCNPIKVQSFPLLIKTILEAMIKIGIPIIALAIIYSGFLFVTARGNTEQLKNAKRSLTYTLIGGAVLLGSWTIAQVISETVLAL